MKKFLAAAAALAIVAPATVSADGLNGFSLGATLGLNSLRTESSQLNTAGTGVKDHFSKSNANFGLIAGYSKTYGQVYVGGEVAFAFASNASKNSRFNANVLDKESKVKAGNSWRPALKIGFLAAPKTVLFASLGATNTQFNASTTPNVAAITAVSSFKKRLWGFSAGVGAQTFVADKVSTTLEYIYTSYGKKNVAVLNAAGTAYASAGETFSFKPTDHQVRLGVSYHF